MKKITMRHQYLALASGLALSLSSGFAVAQSANLVQASNALDCLTMNTCAVDTVAQSVDKSKLTITVNPSDPMSVGNALTTIVDRLNKVERRANAGVASALALQAPAVHSPGKTVMRLGAGYFNKEAAVGVSFRATSDNGRYSLTGGVATNVKEKNQGVAGSVGAEFAFDTW